MVIPDIKSPEAFDAALAVVHEAWTNGQISPAEAESCQRLINGRYRGWEGPGSWQEPVRCAALVLKLVPTLPPPPSP